MRASACFWVRKPVSRRRWPAARLPLLLRRPRCRFLAPVAVPAGLHACSETTAFHLKASTNATLGDRAQLMCSSPCLLSEPKCSCPMTKLTWPRVSAAGVHAQKHASNNGQQFAALHAGWTVKQTFSSCQLLIGSLTRSFCAVGMQGDRRPWQHAAQPHEALSSPAQPHLATPGQQRVWQCCQLASKRPAVQG
jgi:hypothetical protein